MKETGVKRIKSSPKDEDKPKMIRLVSYAPPAPEEKVALNEVNINVAEDDDFTTPLNSFNTIAKKLKIPETGKNIREGEEGLENIREKRKVKPSESLKSPYFERVVVMKNNVHDNEKKVADTIFAARGDLDDVLFNSYFVDGQRIHFKSFKEGNEVSAGVIYMWAYVLNQSERKRSTGSLKKLFYHTSIISAEMETKSVNSKANMSKFVEEMMNLLFISVYQSIKDIDLRCLFIKYLKDNGYPHFKELDEYKAHGNVFKKIEDLRKKYMTKILLSEYSENAHVVESEIEDYHLLTLQNNLM
ncbi:hypothetical protein CTI12_AA420480 [Artemisia annua]|uniref:Uncharacterized protein n=1 Tax=Artemisia annua TaxID=35608 RepID=A0A2U1L4C8_ARTAN|nr:hypothetical protein CTI12_AA420480 [Artemisia annua]